VCAKLVHAASPVIPRCGAVFNDETPRNDGDGQISLKFLLILKLRCVR
jgi:hypothetical protein